MRWRWRGKNAPKLERQNMQNQTIFELDTDDNKENIPAVLRNKKIYEKLQAVKFLTEGKYLRL